MEQIAREVAVCQEILSPFTRGNGQPSAIGVMEGASPSKATGQQIADLVFLQGERGLSVSAVKGYHTVLNHVSSLGQE